MKRYLMILLFVSLIMSACASESGSLVGAWKLTAYGPQNSPTPAVTDSGAMLTFGNDGTVFGNSGCNGFSGEYTVDGNEISFSEIISTLMACDDPVMAQETAIQKVLAGSATYKIEGNTLTLASGDNILVLTAGTHP